MCLLKLFLFHASPYLKREQANLIFLKPNLFLNPRFFAEEIFPSQWWNRQNKYFVNEFMTLSFSISELVDSNVSVFLFRLLAPWISIAIRAFCAWIRPCDKVHGIDFDIHNPGHKNRHI